MIDMDYLLACGKGPGTTYCLPANMTIDREAMDFDGSSNDPTSGWRLGEDDLIVCDGNTYVFTNQWGARWAEFMKELRDRYSEINLEFTPTVS